LAAASTPSAPVSRTEPVPPASRESFREALAAKIARLRAAWAEAAQFLTPAELISVSREVEDLEIELDVLDREERKARGLSDPLWFGAYYLPEKFTCAFGPHHEQIVNDYVEMVVDRTLPSAPQTDTRDWRSVQVLVDRDGIPAGANIDREEGESEEDAAKRLPSVYYSPDEWEALTREQALDAAPRSAADACPRQHGKTSIYDLLRLHAVAYKLTRFMMIGADTMGQGKAYLSALKAELEGNERFRDDFGDLVPKKGGKWTEVDIITSTGIRVVVFGTRTKIRGAKYGDYRPDLVILDDGENDEFVDTEAQRQKTLDWLTKVLIPCLDNQAGVLIVVGTILHHDSMLARLLSKDHFKTWRKRLYRALYQDVRKVPSRKAALGYIEKLVQWSLWPSRWPVSRLLQERWDIGPVAFEAEYQNEPMADEASAFKLEGLKAAKERGRGRRFCESWDDVVRAMGGVEPLAVFQAWDFGWVRDKDHAEASDSNYTFSGAVAIHPETRHLVVLRLYRERGMTPAQTRQRMEAEAAYIRPDELDVMFRVAVETVGLQKELYFHGVRSSSDLPLKAINTDKRKRHLRDGVPGLSAYFENGQIELPYPEGDDPQAIEQRALVDVLCNELWGWGKEGHDDGVMMLWFLMTLVRKFLRALDRRRQQGGATDARWQGGALDDDSAGDGPASGNRQGNNDKGHEPLDVANLEAMKAQLEAELAALQQRPARAGATA